MSTAPGRHFMVAIVSAALLISAVIARSEEMPQLDTALKDFARPQTVPRSRTNPSTPEKITLGQMLLDGRAATLEDQAKGPLTSAKEMDMPAELAIARIMSIPGYVSAFEHAFPGKSITLDSIAAALACYERTIVSYSAPFDQWVAGDGRAITSAAKRGFALFNGKANCAVCHVGWRMTDDGFHDIGISDSDRGRTAVAPGIVQLEYAFKTPTLRNITQRAPYMHDGSLATLSAVTDHYDDGFVRRPSLDTQMHALGLTAYEKSDLLAFLGTLTSVDAPAVIPVLPQ